MMKRVLPIVLVSGLAFANEPIHLPKNANGKLMMTDDSSMFIAGSGELASLTKIDFESKQVTELTLPNKPIMYSLGTLNNHSEIQAFVLTTEGVFHVTDKQPKLLIATNSLYRENTFSQFEHQAFTFDANADGLTDFYLPGIESQTVYFQLKSGKFSSVSIPLKSNTVTRVNQGKLTVSHTLPKMPTLTDVNGDGIDDIVFYDQGKIQYFLYSDKGISEQVETLLNFDSSNKQRFAALKDVNNDGYPDLHTKESLSDKSGDEVNFDGETIHRIFLAQHSHAGLKYNDIPEIQRTLDGISSIADISDFDGDGVDDLAVISFDIGFTDIISMASAAMKNKAFELDSEVSIFKGKGNNQFTKKAKANKDFEIAVNINGSSEEEEKSILFKDFNGDNLTDLLVKTDTNELSVYFGDSKRGLSRKAKRIKRELPKAPSDIYTHDINQDGVPEVILKIKDKSGNYKVDVLYIQ